LISKPWAAGAVSGVYFLTQVVFCHAAETGLWAGRRQAAKEIQRTAAGLQYAQLPASASFPFSPSSLIPTSAVPPLAARPAADDIPVWLTSLISPFGQVDEAKIPAGARRVVVHVQDVHDVYEAQKNIAAILENIAASPAAGRLVVGVEGASGPLALDAYRRLTRADVAARVADAMVKEGLFSGPEYFGVATKTPALLWGVEEPASYRANVQAVQESLAFQNQDGSLVQALGNRLADLKQHLFPPAALDMDRRVDAFWENRLNLTAHAVFLAQAVPSAVGHNTALFLKAVDREKKLDFHRVEKERNALVRALVERLAKADMERLLNASLALRDGRLGHGRYFADLRALCRARGVSLSGYDALDEYIRYVVEAEAIDRGGLLAEIQALEKTALAARLPDEKARALAVLSQDFRLLKKLTALSLTPDEWAACEERRAALARLPERLARFDGAAAAGGQDFAKLLARHERFFREAESRNAHLTTELLKKTGPSGVAVLVAGGFHRPGLRAALLKEGVGYVALTPRLTSAENLPNYLAAFAQAPTPLDRLLAGERVFIKSALGTAAAPLYGTGYKQEVVFSARAVVDVVGRFVTENGLAGRPEARRVFTGSLESALETALTRLSQEVRSIETGAAAFKGIQALNVALEETTLREGEVAVEVAVTPRGAAAAKPVRLVVRARDGAVVFSSHRPGLWEKTRSVVAAWRSRAARPAAAARVVEISVKRQIFTVGLETVIRGLAIGLSYPVFAAFFGNPAAALLAAVIFSGIFLFAFAHKIVSWLRARWDPQWTDPDWARAVTPKFLSASFPAAVLLLSLTLIVALSAGAGVELDVRNIVAAPAFQWAVAASGAAQFGLDRVLLREAKTNPALLKYLLNMGMPVLDDAGRDVGRPLVKNTVPAMEGKVVLEATMEMALTQEALLIIELEIRRQAAAGGLAGDALEHFVYDKLRDVGMSNSAGGIGPLLKERVIAQAYQGARPVGVSLLYDTVWRQVRLPNEDGTSRLELQKVEVGRYIRAVSELAGEVEIEMYDGRTQKVKVWRVPSGAYGAAEVYFLDAPGVTDVMYPGAKDAPQVVYGQPARAAWGEEIRNQQNWVLGRGALAVMRDVRREKPDITVMSEAPTVFSYHRLARDEFQDDPFFADTQYVFNDHTPLEYAHPKVSPQQLEKMRVDPRFYQNLPVWAGDKVDVTALIINASDAVYGVAKKHADVMRAMPLLDKFRDKIHYVTNGVSSSYWPIKALRDGLVNFMSGLDHRPTAEEIKRFLDENPALFDAALADKAAAKAEAVDILAHHVEMAPDEVEAWKKQMLENNPPLQIWLRRTVGYKRLDILLTLLENPDLLERFLKTKIVMVFGGRIHQDDPFGLQQYARLQAMYKNRPELRGRVLFLTNYNIKDAAPLIRGADGGTMFANDGREAAGTSHDKIGQNMGLLLGSEDGSVGESVVSYDKQNPNPEMANGFLVPYVWTTDYHGGDWVLGPTPEGLLDAMEQFAGVYDDPAALRLMRRNAFARSWFSSVERTAEDALNLYARALETAGQRKARREAGFASGEGFQIPASRAHASLSADGYSWRILGEGGEDPILHRGAPGLRGFRDGLRHLLTQGTVGEWSLYYNSFGRDGADGGLYAANHLLYLFAEDPALAPMLPAMREWRERLARASAARDGGEVRLLYEEFLGFLDALLPETLLDIEAVRHLAAGRPVDAAALAADLEAIGPERLAARFGAPALRTAAALLVAVGGDGQALLIDELARRDPAPGRYYEDLLAAAQDDRPLLTAGALVRHPSDNAQVLVFSRVLNGRSVTMSFHLGAAAAAPVEARAQLGESLEALGLRDDRRYEAFDALTGALLTSADLSGRVRLGTSAVSRWAEDGLAIAVPADTGSLFIRFDDRPALDRTIVQVNLRSSTAWVSRLAGRLHVRVGTLREAVRRYFWAFEELRADVYLLGSLETSAFYRDIEGGATTSVVAAESTNDKWVLRGGVPLKRGSHRTLKNGSLFATKGPRILSKRIVGSLKQLRDVRRRVWEGWGGRVFVDFVTNHLALESPLVRQWLASIEPADWENWGDDAQAIRDRQHDWNALNDYLTQERPGYFPSWRHGRLALMPYTGVIYKPLADDELNETDDNNILSKQENQGYFMYYRDRNDPSTRLLVAYGNGEWEDVVQLNYAHEGLRNMMRGAIKQWAKDGFHLRADMAHLANRLHVKGKWYGHLTQEQFDRLMPREFWAEVMADVLPEVPDFVVLGEVAAEDHKELLRELGLHTYEKENTLKKIMDMKLRDFSAWVRNSSEVYMRGVVAHLQDHDDPIDPGATALYRQKDRNEIIEAVLTSMAALPNAPVAQVEVLAGQRQNRKVYMEENALEFEAPPAMDLWERYLKWSGWRRTLEPVMKNGRHSVLRAQNGHGENEDILAQAWEDGDDTYIIVTNLSKDAQQGALALPAGLAARVADGHAYRAVDIYERDVNTTHVYRGDDLRRTGLHVELKPWQSHVLHFSKNADVGRTESLTPPAQFFTLSPGVKAFVPTVVPLPPAVKTPSRWKTGIHGMATVPPSWLRVPDYPDVGIGKWDILETYVVEGPLAAGFDMIHVTPYGQIGPGQASLYALLSPYAEDEEYANWLSVEDVPPAEREGFLAALRALRETQIEYVDRGRVRRLEQSVGQAAWENFSQTQPAERWARFQEFRQENEYWLAPYAVLAAVADILGKSPMEANPLELALAFRDQERLQELAEYHAYAQWITRGQRRAAFAAVAARGVGIVVDLPYYQSATGAVAWARPDLLADGHPGPLDESGEGKWKDLRPYNWPAVEADDFSLITDPLRYWLAEGNIAGFRRDVAPSDYERPHFHNSGHEPGDRLRNAVQKVADDYDALNFAETLGANEEAADNLREAGSIVMEDLKWQDKEERMGRDGVLVTIEIHDHPRAPRRKLTAEPHPSGDDNRPKRRILDAHIPADSKEHAVAALRRALGTNARYIGVVGDYWYGDDRPVNDVTEEAVERRNWLTRRRVTGHAFDARAELREVFREANEDLRRRNQPWDTARARGRQAAQDALDTPGGRQAVAARKGGPVADHFFPWQFDYGRQTLAVPESGPGFTGLLAGLAAVRKRDEGPGSEKHHMYHGHFIQHVMFLLTRAGLSPLAWPEAWMYLNELLMRVRALDGAEEAARPEQAQGLAEIHEELWSFLAVLAATLEPEAQGDHAAAQFFGDLADVLARTLDDLTDVLMGGTWRRGRAALRRLAQDDVAPSMESVLDALYRIAEERVVPFQEGWAEALAAALPAGIDVENRGLIDETWHLAVHAQDRSVPLRVRMSDAPAFAADPFNHTLALNRPGEDGVDILFQAALFDLLDLGLPEVFGQVVRHEIGEAAGRAMGLSAEEAHAAAAPADLDVAAALQRRAAAPFVAVLEEAVRPLPTRTRVTVGTVSVDPDDIVPLTRRPVEARLNLVPTAALEPAPVAGALMDLLLQPAPPVSADDLARALEADPALARRLNFLDQAALAEVVENTARAHRAAQRSLVARLADVTQAPAVETFAEFAAATLEAHAVQAGARASVNDRDAAAAAEEALRGPFIGLAQGLLDIGRAVGWTPVGDGEDMLAAMARHYAAAFMEAARWRLSSGDDVRSGRRAPETQGTRLLLFDVPAEADAPAKTASEFVRWLRALPEELPNIAVQFMTDGDDPWVAVEREIAKQPDAPALTAKLAKARPLIRVNSTRAPGLPLIAPDGRIDMEREFEVVLRERALAESDVASFEVFSPLPQRLMDPEGLGVYWAIYEINAAGLLRVSGTLPAALELIALIRSQA